jgi:hypothetical protein
MISRVTKFRTSDNQEFNTEAEAKKHELDAKTINELSKLLEGSIRTGRMEAVLKEILLEQSAVRNLLVGYNKKQPKAKAPPKRVAA